ncbi:hypothetical protein Tco_0422274, partial [Tanacetum coccineum]
YNAVPPPYTGKFMPPKPDLSFSSLEEFVNKPIISESTVKKPVVESSEAKASADKSKTVRKNNGASIIKDWVFDSEEEEQVKSPRKTTIKQGNQNRQNTHAPRGNKRNWNNMIGMKWIFKKKSKKKAKNKQIQAREGKDQVKSKSKVIRMKKIQPEGLKLPSLKLYYKRLKRQGPKLPTAQRLQLSYKTSGDQTAYSPKKSSFPPQTTTKNSNFNQKVNTARPKAVLNAVKGNQAHDGNNVLVLSDFEEMMEIVAVGGTQRGKHEQRYRECHNWRGGNAIDGKADEGFFVGYSINSKAFRVFNSRIRIVEENLYVQFSENTPNITRSGPNWLFDIDALTKSMNYKPFVGTNADPSFSQSSKSSSNARFKPSRDNEKKVTEEPGKEGGDPSKEDERDDQEKDASVNRLERLTSNNLNTFMPVSPIPTTRIHKDHPVEQEYLDLKFLRLKQEELTKNLGRTWIEEEVYVCPPLDLEDSDFLTVNTKNDLLFGSTKIHMQSLRGEEMIIKFQRSSMVELTILLRTVIAFLAKPAESEGFEQIVDFLNANPIRYALTINTTIYTSSIEQFWDIVKAKTIKGEVQLQALVDGKKVIVTEASVTRDLQLDDEEGMDCLPNATIFEELTRIGMVKNLDNAGKFLIYLRFVQVFLDKQLEGMQSHKRIYDVPCHTKKIFRNMKRVEKGFSGRETPLFPTMVIQAQEEMGEGLAIPTDPHHTPIQPSTSQPQKKQRSRKPKRKDTEVPQPSSPTNNIAYEAVYEEMDDSLVRAATTATGLDVEQDSGNINKTQSNNTNKSSSLGLVQEITSLKLRVKKLEKKGGSRTHKLKRLYKVGRSARIVSSDEASLGDQEYASKERKSDNMINDGRDTLVDETSKRACDDIMFNVSDLAGEEVFVAEQGVPDSKKDDAAQDSTAATNTLQIEESAKPTIAASTRPKAKGLVIHEKTSTTPTFPSLQPSQQKFRQVKAKMIEPEHVKNCQRKILLKLMRSVKLQAGFNEQERIEREKAEKEAKVNIALKET